MLTVAQIAVGDLLMVKCNESLPADIVMFYSANPDGIAYIETSNLDGCVLCACECSRH